jgi:hypothetical protein
MLTQRPGCPPEPLSLAGPPPCAAGVAFVLDEFLEPLEVGLGLVLDDEGLNDSPCGKNDRLIPGCRQGLQSRPGCRITPSELVAGIKVGQCGDGTFLTIGGGAPESTDYDQLAAGKVSDGDPVVAPYLTACHSLRGVAYRPRQASSSLASRR